MGPLNEMEADPTLEPSVRNTALPTPRFQPHETLKQRTPLSLRDQQPTETVR